MSEIYLKNDLPSLVKKAEKEMEEEKMVKTAWFDKHDRVSEEWGKEHPNDCIKIIKKSEVKEAIENSIKEINEKVVTTDKMKIHEFDVSRTARIDELILLFSRIGNLTYEDAKNRLGIEGEVKDAIDD